MQQKQTGVWIGVLIAMVIAFGALIIALVGHPAPAQKADSQPSSFGSAVNGGNVTDYTAVNTTAGYWVGSVQIANSSGISAAALATFRGGVLNSYTNSTSTSATTQTLLAADIANYSTVILTPTVGAVTLTLPASSTLATFVPTAGDRQEQCWINASSTAAATIKFAAGTGIDLEFATSSSLILGAGNSGCFKYIRKPATASTFDIIAQWIGAADAD